MSVTLIRGRTGVRVLGIPTNIMVSGHSTLIPLYFLKNQGLYGSEMGCKNKQPQLSFS
jgi:hypothetical protein